MQLISINIGTIATLSVGDRTYETAIYKRPVKGPVRIGKLGVRGDKQADLDHHGGPDQAVHMMPFEHYSFWSTRFGQTLYGPGQLGENFTTRGLLEADVCIGDKLRIGGALLQVTKPRTPCMKLEAVMAIRGFAAVMSASGRTGWYLRVLEEGVAEEGNEIVIEKRDPAAFTLPEAFAVINGGKADRDVLERAAAVTSLTPGLRKKIETLMEKLPES